MSVSSTSSSQNTPLIAKHRRRVRKKHAESKVNDVAIQKLEAKEPTSNPKKIRRKVRRVKVKTPAESTPVSSKTKTSKKSQSSQASISDDIAIATLGLLDEFHHPRSHEVVSQSTHWHSSASHHNPSRHCSNQHISAPERDHHSTYGHFAQQSEPSSHTSLYDANHNSSSYSSSSHMATYDSSHHSPSFDTSSFDHHHG